MIIQVSNANFNSGDYSKLKFIIDLIQTDRLVSAGSVLPKGKVLNSVIINNMKIKTDLNTI
jgi:hypothetical protein